MRRSTALKLGFAVILLVGLGWSITRIDLRRDLRKLRVKMYSGSPEGNYHALVTRMAALASQQKGAIDNASTAGSIENLQRLSQGCDGHFALVQDGQEWPKGLELAAQLPRAESFFLLGKNADKIIEPATLKGLKIGIGPEGSGTAKIAEQIFSSRDLKALGVVTSHHPLSEQVEMAARGELDLAALVMDEDGPLVDRAVRDLGLQIAGLAHAEVIAAKVPHMHTGRIAAGHYDAVRVLPPVDKPVLQIRTLVVGNGCASRSAAIGLMTVLDATFPELVVRNKSLPNTTGLPFSDPAKSYYENGGPDVFDEYAPWLVDIMPAGRWVYLITALSILFNIMGFGNRFQLWRIDAQRVKLETALMGVFGTGLTVGDIARLDPGPEHSTQEIVDGVKRLIADLEALAAKSRKQSLSILVPMGQELAYRYQESLMFETMTVLRSFLRRVKTQKAA